MIIITLHGYNVRDGGVGSVDTFYDCLVDCGHRVKTGYADYGWMGILGTRFGGIKRVAKALAEKLSQDSSLDEDVCLLCHSNGLAIAQEVIKHTSKVHTIVAFNGALDQDAPFAGTVERVINFYAPADQVLRWGAWLRPGHVWGRAGQAGLTSDDERIENYIMEDVKGHSSVFHVKALRTKYAKRTCELLS